MARKSGGNLRPGAAKKQEKVPTNKLVLKALQSCVAAGIVATQASFNRLRRWLGYQAAGSTVDYRTVFFARRDPRGRLQYTPREEIVQRFDDVYKSVAKGTDGGGYLHEIEMAERDGIGPISMFLPFEADGPEKVKAVYRDKPRLPGFDEGAYTRALERTASLVEAQSCTMVSPEEAIEGTGAVGTGMDTTTNSGEPFWVRRWKPSADEAPVGGAESEEERHAAFAFYVERTKDMVSFMMQARDIQDLPLMYATASQRLVAKGPKPFNPKSKRLVIAFPKDEAIRGNMVLHQIMDALREACMPSGNRIMAGWFDQPTIDRNMQIILSHAEAHAHIVNSGDVSAFDATVPPWLLADVGRVVGSWVRGGQHFVENMVNQMIYRTALITPVGIVRAGPSSLKSGSWCTNLMGSLSNITIHFYGQELGLYQLDSLSVLGDDSVSSGNGVDPDATSETFASFGMDANAKKQFYQSGALQFLKRLHVLGMPGGIYSAYRALGSCLSLERLNEKPKDWSPWAYVVQALSKLSNLHFSPYLEPLTEFIASGDRYRLGAGVTPDVVASSAGKVGQRIIDEYAQLSWRSAGEGTTFADWLVNGVLRGEVAPPLGPERYRRVYGHDFTLTN